MKSAHLRQAFIDFFVSKGHTAVKSSPVVPQNDPTLLFTNAGMNQFKDVFLGQGTRDYTRAVNSQVCIRVSGKHNDLEDVGLDTTHLTLFEMLGNWSFGDYYKKEAISWAWEFLTSVLNLPKSKLYATVYKTDDESIHIWQETTDIIPEHVLKFGDKENFWEMGETGPCGPCSELHLDRGPRACDKPRLPHVCAVNGDCARYIELWNLVFIQYNRHASGVLENLPSTHVDTGAGLERLAAYLQHTSSNYETDLFLPIIQKIEALSGIRYEDTPKGMPHRVMADHIRTLTFSISDNVMPSNEGRGYVLRRLLRRALRYAAQLGLKDPVLHTLVDPVIEVMGGHFEAIVQRKDFIKAVIKAEEEGFLRTLQSGLIQFDLAAQKASYHDQLLSGEEAFKLYDTFGFPIDLTQLMAKEKGLRVDQEGFDQALAQARQKSRQHIKLHQANFKAIPMGGEARIVTDPAEKLDMAKHHTSTHLLQAALRHLLGDHVYQAGSLVDTHRLRFDFSHFQSIDKKTLDTIEDLVNQKVQEDIEIEVFEKPLEEAKAMGAMALFGEKYEDIVRVIRIGDFSMELCVGTHVPSTSVIEKIKIIHEAAISAGTRRIEALAGTKAIQAYESEKKQAVIDRIETKMAHIHALIEEKNKFGQSTLPPLFSLSEENTLIHLEQKENEIVQFSKDLEKSLTHIKNKEAGNHVQDLLKNIHAIGTHGFRFLSSTLHDYDMSMLRVLGDNLITHQIQLIVILASGNHILIRVSDDICVQLGALKLLSQITQITGGKGGGKPSIAQAGGIDITRFESAIAFVKSQL